MTAAQASVLRLRAHRENLRALGEDRDGLVQYLSRVPEDERRETRLALDAARCLIAAGDCGEAAHLIEDSLDEVWDSSLVSAYGTCAGGDVLRRISHAEKWLLSHPRDAQLLLTLGRLCRRQQLWGKAQSYLEASLSVQPLPECHLELAQLLDYLERPDEANRHYRAAAGLSQG
jgi:HemY protein